MEGAAGIDSYCLSRNAGVASGENTVSATLKALIQTNARLAGSRTFEVLLYMDGKPTRYKGAPFLE
jgi:hypothetical protein